MRELRKWLFALALIIAAGIISLIGVLIWMQVVSPTWDQPEAINLPSLPLVAVLVLFPLLIGAWLLAAAIRILAFLIERLRRERAPNPDRAIRP